MNAAGRIQSTFKQAAKAVVMPFFAARFRRDLRQFRAPYCLHLGCGYHHLDGWVNIDFIETPAVDVWWNLGQPIPLEDGSCQYIYHEHVLEHFEPDRGLELLRECHRLLEPGGVLRVAMPSLEDMLEKYSSGAWRDIDDPHMPLVKTGAEYLNVCFRAWGHRWIYDAEELERRLHDVGFRYIARQALHQSDRSGLRGIEHREDSLLIYEAIKQ